MGRFLISPGVITREIDQSQYTATTPGAGNVAAVVGYAEKGPFEPTIVRGIQDFVLTFGSTLADMPYLAQTAYKYFEEGEQLLVTRAGNDKDPATYSEAAQYASKSVRIDPLDSTSGMQSVGFTVVTAVNDTAITASGDTTYTADIVVDGGSNPINFDILDTEAMTYAQVITEINSDLTGAIATFDATATNGAIKIVSDTTGDASTILIADTNLFNSLSNFVINSAVPGADEVGEAVVSLVAKEKGTYGNNLIFRSEKQTVNYGSTQIINYNVTVLWNGKEVASYPKVNWEDNTDENYITTRLANDKYLEIQTEDEDGDSIFAMLPFDSGDNVVVDWVLGTGDLPSNITAEQALVTDFQVGSNGWVTAGDVITSLSSDFATALLKIYNPEVYEFNLVAAPGGSDPIVQNAVQSLCDARRDCFGVIDAAPVGLGMGIKDGSAGDITDVNAACSTVTSSYVGVFWPWCQDYDADNSQYIWLPPSIYAMKQMVYTDNIADPWYAPAGTRRGRVTALDVEYSPTRLDRDLLYGGTNIVNPIVKFVNEGITIWGQKTAQRVKSATDRINVRRLLIYSEKLIAKMARGFLFEPNDTSNYSAFSRQANAILEPIRQRRGLQTYTVICDESTNPPEMVDQNIMAGKIFVQPMKSIEFIEVSFTINAQGDVEITE